MNARLSESRVGESVPPPPSPEQPPLAPYDPPQPDPQAIEC